FIVHDAPSSSLRIMFEHAVLVMWSVKTRPVTGSTHSIGSLLRVRLVIGQPAGAGGVGAGAHDWGSSFERLNDSFHVKPWSALFIVAWPDVVKTFPFGVTPTLGSPPRWPSSTSATVNPPCSSAGSAVALPSATA